MVSQDRLGPDGPLLEEGPALAAPLRVLELAFVVIDGELDHCP